MKKLGLCVVACSLLLLALPAAAQMGEGNIARVIFIKPKPGMAAQFEAGVKKHLEWHRAQKDTWEWPVWMTISGEGTGTYGVGSFGHNWEEFDTAVVSLPAHEADVQANIAPFVESFQVTYWAFLKDVSRPGEGEAPMGSVLTFRLQQGKDDDFRHLLKKAREAADKTNRPVRTEWYELVNGGDHPTFALVIPRANWAAFKPPAQSFPAMLEEVYGRHEAEQLLDGFTKCVKHVSSEIFRTRPDLSYTPEKK